MESDGSSPTPGPTGTQGDVVAALRDFPTVCALFQATVRASGDRVAFRRHGADEELTWRQADEQVRALAGGLTGLGVGSTENGNEDVVALLLPNVPDFHIADLAVLHAGGVPFSLYPTDPVSRMHGFLDAAGATILLTDASGLPRAEALLADGANLQAVVVLGDADVGADARMLTVKGLLERTPPGFDADAAWASLGPETTACLMYTSGTTGVPKGVQIPHRAIVASIAQYAEVAPFTPHGRVLSYLPTAHIADRWAAHYAAVAAGHTVTCVPDHTYLYEALQQTRPTHFFAVPRILEKLADHAADVLAKDAHLADLHAARLAEIRTRGEIEPRTQASRFAAVHTELGLDAAEWMTVGSAPSARPVLESMAALDLPFADVWGMTEIIVCAMNRPERLKLGSIGRALPGIEFRLDDGELLATGPTMMTGYRGDPEQTRATLGADNWVRTGDLAEIDEDGYVWIRGRRKEMIINSAGKNMSPLTIEGAVKTSSTLIDQVAVAGDGRRFVVALISLDAQRLRAFAGTYDLPGDHATLSRDPVVLAEVEAAVARANATLSRTEHVRAWRVVEDEWRPGGEEVSASMKLMRDRVLVRYAAIVEELYA